MTRFFLLFLTALLALTQIGCVQQNNFEVIDFTPISKASNEDIVNYSVDLTNAITDGIIIPTKNGELDYFKFQFKLKNTGEKAQRYSYKLFYQNESYAHDLFLGDEEQSKNPKADRNFYGSWNEENSGFRSTDTVSPDGEYILVTDSFSIAGNPRNEAAFFGSEFTALPPSDEEIESEVAFINESPDWLRQIKTKAELNNTPLQEQVYLDALWNLNIKNQRGDFNNRWKRNPRTGLYNFMLVVIEADRLDTIPMHYQDVTVRDTITSSYQNPYPYYLSQDRPAGVVKMAQQKLQVKVSYDLSKGVYAEGASVINPDSITKYAQLEQYYHSTDKKNRLNNIPQTSDISTSDYTQEDYTRNATKYSKDELISDYLRITQTPRSTVGYDSEEKAIFLTNPGNKDLEQSIKESTGVKTRHGFTYGKYIAKVKFPKIINSDYVWNGLTCAFWLKYQTGDWNRRSSCNSGFNPKFYSDSARVKSSIYSEIDIEIVKTSKYWPRDSYYKNNMEYKVDDALNNNVIIGCTNWDLACHDPEDFHVGVIDIEYEKQTFALHRWHDDYRALTSKYEYEQDKTLGQEFYYVIEWYPTHIAWKVGPTKDNLQLIGYMDDKSTMIPDNQMKMIFTQEYHLSEWWPLTPFKQEFIPYLLNDITGYIYEVEIE